MENTDINISALENVDIDRILKEAIKEKIEKLMEIELNAYLEDNPGIKNGKYKRDLKTKYGEIKQLNVPRDRESNFHTQVIDPYSRSIGIEDLIVSMYSNGISTRRIAGIMEDILGNKYSKSTISRITDLTMEEVYKFINRPLDKRYIAIFLDYLLNMHLILFPLLPHPDSLFHLLQLTMAPLILYYTDLLILPCMHYVIL